LQTELDQVVVVVVVVAVDCCLDKLSEYHHPMTLAESTEDGSPW
jgi:hypothetical protein